MKWDGGYLHKTIDSSAGTGDSAPAEDIEGNPRKTPPDMGAYESG